MTNQQIKQRIGQLEASCDDMEDNLDEREFQDYCDHIYSCISYYRQVLYKNNKEVEEVDFEENTSSILPLKK